jgi:hypothetical protein
VFGNVLNGRSPYEDCLVNAEKMYTVILAMYWEQNFIKNNVERFRSEMDTDWSGKYYLLFISTTNTVGNELCGYAFAANSVLLMCVRTFSLADIFRGKTTSSNKVWKTSLRIHYSPYIHTDTVAQRESFTQQSVEEFLVKQTLKKANESARKYSLSRIRDPALATSSAEYEILTSSTVLVDDLTTRFISCFEKPTLKFQMYAKPFAIEVWVSLTLCCSIVSILIYTYNRIFNLSGSFSSILFFVSTLVEASYSVPRAIANSRVFKIITLVWALSAIIFTNIYIGLVISDVTAPVRGEIFDTFNKVLGIRNDNRTPSPIISHFIRTFWMRNYTKTMHMNGTILNMFTKGCEDIYIEYGGNLYGYDPRGYESHHAQFRTSDSFAILQKQIEKCEGFNLSNLLRKRFLSHPWMYDVFYRLFDELLLYYRLKNDLGYARRLYAFFSPKLRHYPKDPNFPMHVLPKIPLYLSASIEKEIVACERSVFVGESKDVNLELSYLKTNYPRKHFYVSNDTFEDGSFTPVIWLFIDAGNSNVPLYFKLLLEAGVRNVLLGLRKHKYYLKRRVGTQFVQEEMLIKESVGMSGSIQTIFIISIACLSMATLVFLLEVVYMNKFLFTVYTTLNNTFIKTLDTMRICILRLSTLIFNVQRKK